MKFKAHNGLGFDAEWCGPLGIVAGVRELGEGETLTLCIGDHPANGGTNIYHVLTILHVAKRHRLGLRKPYRYVGNAPWGTLGGEGSHAVSGTDVAEIAACLARDLYRTAGELQVKADLYQLQVYRVPKGVTLPTITRPALVNG